MRIVFRALVFVCSLAPWATANAGTISFTGNLRSSANFTGCGTGCMLSPADSDATWAQWAAFSTNFTIPLPEAVKIVTFSYGGGTNGNGAPIAQGGFEPYLSLFDEAGNFLNSTFFGVTCPPGANTNSVSGQCFDVLLDAGVLAAGTYQVAISAFENMSLAENNATGTLADGFTGLGNLAPGEDLHYAFDIEIGGSSIVPEPGTDSMVALAAIALIGISRTGRREVLIWADSPAVAFRCAADCSRGEESDEK